MSIAVHSRYRFCVAREDDAGRLYTDERSLFAYRDREDNRTHVVASGDTLWSIAAKAYPTLDYAAELWWVVADYQVDENGESAPIHDPTVALTPGTVLILPSLATVLSEALAETRRPEHDAV